MANERPPIDLDSAGVYFMTVEEFEGRAPAKPAGAETDAERAAAPEPAAAHEAPGSSSG